MRIVVLLLMIVLYNNILKAQNLPVHTTLNDFYLDGSQPLESGDLSAPATCSCHDYKTSYIYPKWEASMMAHAVEDPLFLAAFSIARQDADSSGDLCLRCHTPTGWLSGRSTPTDGRNLISEDETSVNCKFCHRIVQPTPWGVNPYPTDEAYYFLTLSIDQEYLYKINGHIPITSGNGMYVVDTLDGFRRGPFSDATSPRHETIYSPFHRRADLCGTCHDVSNPVYDRKTDDTYELNELDTPAPDFDPYAMFPVERTYSEWKNSSFNTQTGISGTPFGGSKTSVSTCQDCHMPEVFESVTNNPNKRYIKMHNMNGGNTFIPSVLSSMSSEVQDSSIARATWMIQHAASMEVTAEYQTIKVRVYNETGHKLPSGYPEGRRIWLNVKAFDALKTQIFESGAYDPSTGVLNQDEQIKVYEIKPGISNALASTLNLGTGGPSFHFVLNDTIFKDNRIPPLGFTNANYVNIQSPPVHYAYPDGQNWDETVYTLTQMPDSVSVTLYYQTTSKEYIEFLQNQNTTDTNGDDLYTLWNDNGKAAPVVMAQVELSTQDISLAVTLSGFTVELSEGHPVISWQTYSEQENLGFEILRSSESNHQYQEIATYKTNKDLEGLGNSSIGKSYEYIDEDSELESGKTYYYKLIDVAYDGLRNTHGPVSVVYRSPDDPIITEFVLQNNYPNPFNAGTVIPFLVPDKQTVSIRIFDLQGRLIRDFPEFLYNPGANKIYWDMRDNYGRLVASGFYIYQVTSRNFKAQKKMLMIK